MTTRNLCDEIRKRLLLRGDTIAVAESVTGGMLQAAFASTPDASKFFHGGVTAYNLGQKCRLLDVNAIHAEECDCVSALVANQMAQGVCKLFNSDWSIGITGYATKVAESRNKLFAFYAICHHGEIRMTNKIESKLDDPQKTQQLYIKIALEAFLQNIQP